MKKLLALSVFALPVMASAITLSGSVGFINESPSGYINYHSDGTSNNVDVKNNLGLSSKTKPWVRLKLNTDGIPVLPNLEFDYLPMKFDGSASNQNFTYDGYNFNGTVNSSVKMDHYDIFAYYHVPFIRTASKGVLNPKLGLGVRIVDFSADVSGTATRVNGIPIPPQTKTVSKSATLPIPMLYAALDVRPTSFLHGDFHIKGIGYGSNLYYDVVGEAKVYPTFIKNSSIGQHVFLGVGYRYEELKIDASSVKSDVKVDGPFAEVGVVF